MNWRSLLFIGADDTQRIERVTTRGADAVILDLEDGVAPERKEIARSCLAGAVAKIGAAKIPVVVRINTGWRSKLRDLECAVREGVSAIMVPKVEDLDELSAVAAIVSEFADGEKLKSRPGLIALIESPGALPLLSAIAKVDGVMGLALGSEDFSLALGVSPTFEVLDLPCRLIALAAAAHGHMALGIPCSIAALADVDGWRRAIQHGRMIGMTGALCVHPSQIGPANEGFGVNDLEREWARRVLVAWEDAGRPGALRLDGRMIDLPVVLAAQRTIETA